MTAATATPGIKRSKEEVSGSASPSREGRAPSPRSKQARAPKEVAFASDEVVDLYGLHLLLRETRDGFLKCERSTPGGVDVFDLRRPAELPDLPAVEGFMDARIVCVWPMAGEFYDEVIGALRSKGLLLETCDWCCPDAAVSDVISIMSSVLSTKTPCWKILPKGCYVTAQEVVFRQRFQAKEDTSMTTCCDEDTPLDESLDVSTESRSVEVNAVEESNVDNEAVSPVVAGPGSSEVSSDHMQDTQSSELHTAIEAIRAELVHIRDMRQKVRTELRTTRVECRQENVLSVFRPFKRATTPPSVQPASVRSTPDRQGGRPILRTSLQRSTARDVGSRKSSKDAASAAPKPRPQLHSRISSKESLPRSRSKDEPPTPSPLRGRTSSGGRPPTSGPLLSTGGRPSSSGSQEQRQSGVPASAAKPAGKAPIGRECSREPLRVASPTASPKTSARMPPGRGPELNRSETAKSAAAGKSPPRANAFPRDVMAQRCTASRVQAPQGIRIVAR
eukprot:TRINITY_DN16827_c0_g5_i1.p1 TRINITY_DN16827_c0_g5~~TRINITY_DN16827_c0_g5_i1.p1  ORF type:complete len:521 (+),score=72.71 TRINITY_DN16827_c0_g5_i1:49-1563(+)